LVFGTLAGSSIVPAQDSNMQPCVGETCPPKPEMQKAPDQSDQVVPQRK
jgi:hypothetical protein